MKNNEHKVVDEYNGLTDKLSDLEALIVGRDFANATKFERALMVKQLMQMVSYRDTLDQRISIICDTK